MPFESKSQLRTCYGKNDPRWDCDKWLKETKSVCSLPEKKKKGKIQSRRIRKNEIVKGPLMIGPRGGRYFIITEKSRGKIKCRIKVYV